MHRRSFLAGLATTAGAIAVSRAETNGPPACAPATAPLTGRQAAQDLRLLQQALHALHPALERYTPLAVLDAAFDRARVDLAAGASLATMVVTVSRLAAAVRCGHTWVNPLNQSPAVQRLFDADDKLPCWLRLVEQRWLVTASADPQIAEGDELLALDGQTPADTVTELLPCLRADGGNDGKRLSQLDSGTNGGAMDRLWPLLHPPRSGRHALRVRRPGGGAARDVDVPALSIAARDATLAARSVTQPTEEWQLRIDGDTAVWTLPTFALWRSSFDWRRALDEGFAALRAAGVAFLVLDLRRNEGGDGDIAETLLAHLLHAPCAVPGSRRLVRYERVPYALARHLDTWDFGFFDRTGQVRREPPPSPWWALQPDDGAARAGRQVLPTASPFSGTCIALIGPQMSSAGHVLARDLRASGAALLVGCPTGSSRRGINGGQLAWLTLPHSGVAVDIPLITSVPLKAQPDEGIVPHLAAAPAFVDAASGIDTERAAASALIDQLRKRRAVA